MSAIKALAPIRPKSLAARELFERTVELSLLTPLFGGGVAADGCPDPRTPIRGSSIRGQLRFWWRATAGAAFPSIEELRKAEMALWGSHEAPGKVDLVIDDRGIGKPKPVPVNNRHPLAYGTFPLDHTSGQLHRFSGTTLLKLRGPIDKDIKAELDLTLDAWITFGGLGGRTRRGFGAVGDGQVRDPKELLARCPGPPPDPTLHPVLHGATIAQAPDAFPTADKAHAHLLKALKHFRQGDGQGRNRPLPGHYAGRSRWPEPDAIRALTRRSSPSHRDRQVHVDAFPRAAFGMPIIFHFKDERGGEPKDTSLQPDGAERLASPIVLRPVLRTDGRFDALVLRLNTPPLGTTVLKGAQGDPPVRATLTGAQARAITPLAGHPDPLDAFFAWFRTWQGR